jgi:tRNA-specific 2-thiouridylase
VEALLPAASRSRDGFPDVRGRRVVVAMSGGVDSSVAAALLAAAGAEVVGVTMKNFCYSGLPAAASTSSCCSLEAIEDARRVADRVGFPHYVLDFEGPFGRAVVEDFVREYASGRTPNPCVRCNRLVRFPHLHARAAALGAELVATGHYARTVRGPDGRPRLLRGADRAKDQSYYLWGLSARLLERTCFPVGHLAKPEVRRIAWELGFEVAEKAESMEVCFVPDGDVRGFLEREAATRELPEEALARFRPGPLISTSGELLGEHAGSAFLTVGQRRGVGVAFGEPRYVVELRGANTVVLGTREDLAARGCRLEQVNWVTGSPGGLGDGAAGMENESSDRTGGATSGGGMQVEVQVRHRQQPVPARAFSDGRDLRIGFEEPVAAVAPGQSAVLYKGDEVLGGGVIAEAFAATLTRARSRVVADR